MGPQCSTDENFKTLGKLREILTLCQCGYILYLFKRAKMVCNLTNSRDIAKSNFFPLRKFDPSLCRNLKSICRINSYSLYAFPIHILFLYINFLDFTKISTCTLELSIGPTRFTNINKITYRQAAIDSSMVS